MGERAVRYLGSCAGALSLVVISVLLEDSFRDTFCWDKGGRALGVGRDRIVSDRTLAIDLGETGGKVGLATWTRKRVQAVSRKSQRGGRFRLLLFIEDLL